MENSRQAIRRIIFGITSFLVVLLGLRFVLEIVDSNQQHAVAQLIFAITDPLMTIFSGMFADAGLGIVAPLLVVVITMIFYIFVGIFVASIITSFINDNPADILMEIIDTMFKLVEFFLIARLVLRLFGIAPNAPFVAFTYDVTGWTSDLLPSIDVMGGELEFSTLFIIVAVVIVDLIFEGLVESVQKDKGGGGGGSSSSKTEVKVAPAAPQNITINVPPQQYSQPQVVRPEVVRREGPTIVNVRAPRHEQQYPFVRKRG